MKGKLLYLLIWGATSYIGLLYYSPSLLGLAVLEFLLPLCSFLLLQLVSRSVEISLVLPVGVAEKHQNFPIGIAVTNRSRMPIPQIQAAVVRENGFYRKKERITLRGIAGGKSSTRLLTEVSGSQCGFLFVEIEQVEICDLFHLFKKKITVKGRDRVAVMPEIYRASVTLQESTRDFLIESEEYDKNKPGDDISEVFQIREYRGGDRLQSIHWKLSARTDDLMVREYSLPIACAVVVFWDMEYDPREGYGELDEFFEAGISISLGLLEAGCEHYAVWYDRSSQDLERMEMKEQDDVYLLIERLFLVGPYIDAVELFGVYQEKYRGETLHTRLCWNLRKELWKNESLELELSGDAREILENEGLLI